MKKEAEKIRQMGRPKVVPDEVRRRDIILAAERLFVENGYRGVSMRGIASELRISLKTIYRIFPDKVTLFNSLIENHRQSVIALPEDYSGFSFIEALYRIFRVDIDAEEERRKARFIHVMLLEGQSSPEVLDIFHRQGPVCSLELLSSWLDGEQKRGRIRLQGDPHIAARMLMNAAFGPMSYKGDADPSWEAAEERTVYLRASLKMIAEGLQPK